MTEEIAANAATEQVESNPVEDKAREMGWMPKEDWVESGKEADKWRSAELFVELEPIFANQAQLKKELRSAKKTLDEFKTHYSRVQDTEYKRAMADLKSQKVAALQDGDAVAVADIDEKITTAVAEQAAAKQEVQRQAQQIHPEFAQWVQVNSWYASNVEMQTFADSMGQAYARNNPGVEPKEVLNYVEAKVKKAFPENFRNSNRDKAPVVEASQSPRRGSSSDVELNDEESRAMKKFVKSGIMTEKEYKDSVKRMREVK